MRILLALAALPAASAFSGLNGRLGSIGSTFVTSKHTPTAHVRPPLRVLGKLSLAGRPTEEGGPLLDVLGAAIEKTPLYESVAATQPLELVGEDAATYKWANEKWGALGETGWTTFFAAVGTILSALAVLWIYSPTGYGDDFLAWLDTLARGNSHLVTLAFGLIFPVVHSGLASLRSKGEQIVGARTWRVIFASASLPLAYSWIVYFIAHAHDGVVFWDLQSVPAAHAVAWMLSFVSFFFLYPTVFNLKEVAAVEKPQVHLWETGMIRVTRHPQMVGQVLWSVAHLAMVGSSFTLLTMALLVSHHVFAAWHGDRRLEAAHGEKFEVVKARTSVVPFAAILDGRQTLPPDVWKEFARAPYALIAVGTLGAYAAHPYMQAGAALVRNVGLVPGGVFDPLFA